MLDNNIPININAAPTKWKNINFSLKIIIAIMVLIIGIKCKNIPDLFAPIIEIHFIQKIKDARPGNNTTYVKVNKKGVFKIALYPIFISTK